MRADHNRSVDLEQLVERLRDASFKIDTRQYLTANQLLLEFAERGRRLEDDSEALCSHLAPIFCTSAEEQERFRKISRECIGAPVETPSGRSSQTTHKGPHRILWLLPAAAVTMAGVWVGILAYERSQRPVQLTGTVVRVDDTGATELARDALVMVNGKRCDDKQGNFSVSLSPSDGDRLLRAEVPDLGAEERTVNAHTTSPIRFEFKPLPPVTEGLSVDINGPTLLHFEAPKDESSLVRYTSWRTVLLLSTLFAAVTFALWSLADWLRRRRVLRSLCVPAPSDFATLPSDDAMALSPEEALVRRAASALRRPRTCGAPELDVRRSAEATARSAGLVSPVYVGRRVVPEYLVLIERTSVEDHQALLYDAMFTRLQNRNVNLDRYFFTGDPRTILERSGNYHPMLLSEVLGRHHRATVLLFCDAAILFSPVTGHLERWVDFLSRAPRCALFTERPEFYWTSRERRLIERGFVVLAATEAGLTSFAEVEGDWSTDRRLQVGYARPFPPSIEEDTGRWLSRLAPPRRERTALLRELLDYLGPRPLAWLAACAVYPEMDWSMTLYLASACDEPDRIWSPAIGEVELRALARLPWFRTGRMPNWLRRDLLPLLSPRQERSVRTQLRRRLDLLAQRSLSRAGQSGQRVARWQATMDVVAGTPPDHPLRDSVFLGFVVGKRRATDLEAPASLSRLLGQVKPLPAGPAEDAGAHASHHTVLNGLSNLFAFRPNLFRVLVSILVGAIGMPVFLRTTTKVSPAMPLPTEVSLAFSPKGDRLLTAVDQHLLIWDVPSARLEGELPGNTAAITAISFNPRGDIAATSSIDGTFRVWRIQTRELLATLNLSHLDVPVAFPDREARPLERKFAPPTTSIEFTRDGNQLLGVGGPGQSVLWDGWDGARYTRNLDFPGSLMARAGDGASILTVDEDGRLSIWDNGKRTTSVELLRNSDATPGSRVKGIDISPNGQTVVVAEGLGGAELLEAKSLKRIHRMGGGPEEVNFAAFSPDNSKVVLTTSGGNTEIWSVQTGTLLVKVPSQPGFASPSFAQISPGSVLLTVSAHAESQRQQSGAWLWDATGNAVSELLRENGPLSAKLSPDGSAVAAITKSAVGLWKIANPLVGCDLTPVYFDFDTQVLNSTAQNLLQHHALCIQQNPDWNIVVEGIVGQRGTPEYQTALAYRRANIVIKYLLDLKINPKRLTSAVSEAPVCGNEECWAKQRRVAFRVDRWPANATKTSRAVAKKLSPGEPIVVQCSSSGQLCVPPFETYVEAGQTSNLQMEFSFTGCSSIRLHVSVDGTQRLTTPFLTYPVGRTGLVNLGTIDAGTHLLSLKAEGRVGGCNKGVLLAWEGTLGLAVVKRSGQGFSEAQKPSTGEPITVQCSSLGQLCDPPFDTSVEADQRSNLQMEFSFTGCSSIRLHVSIDGRQILTTPFLAYPVGGTGSVNLGTINTGSHLLSLQGEGRVGGCNAGVLAAWEGTLLLAVAKSSERDLSRGQPSPRVPPGARRRGGDVAR